MPGPYAPAEEVDRGPELPAQPRGVTPPLSPRRPRAGRSPADRDGRGARRRRAAPRPRASSRVSYGRSRPPPGATRIGHAERDRDRLGAGGVVRVGRRQDDRADRAAALGDRRAIAPVAASDGSPGSTRTRSRRPWSLAAPGRPGDRPRPDANRIVTSSGPSSTTGSSAGPKLMARATSARVVAPISTAAAARSSSGPTSRSRRAATCQSAAAGVSQRCSATSSGANAGSTPGGRSATKNHVENRRGMNDGRRPVGDRDEAVDPGQDRRPPPPGARGSPRGGPRARLPASGCSRAPQRRRPPPRRPLVARRPIVRDRRGRRERRRRPPRRPSTPDDG